MNKKLILYTLVAAIGGLLFGYDTAVINGALPFFKAHFELSNAMTGWAVSSALLGCIFGAAFIGKPGDKYGRRKMLKSMAALFFISALGTALAPSISVFVFARFIGGIAVGGASVISPMYISEIAPANYRGRLTIIFQLAIVIGILVAFFADYLLIDTGVNNWRYMFLSEVVPALFFYTLLFFVGQSPRWLLLSGNSEEALKVIRDINTVGDTEQIYNDIKNSVEQEPSGEKGLLLKKPYFRLILIGIAVGIFNQLTGIAIVMYYATDIFRAAGFSTSSAIGQTVIIGLTNLVFTIFAMMIIDKVGRKKLLLIGTLGMTVFLGLFSLAFLKNIFPGWVSLVLLIGYVAFFASSFGAVIWVLLAEIFPNNIRSRGMSIGSFSSWGANFLLTFFFPIIVGLFNDGKGIGYSFAFFAVMTFIAYFIFKKHLFETKNKTLEQIESENI